MSNPLQQAGTFRGVIYRYCFPDYKRKEGSQSQAIRVTFQIQQAWDADINEWVDWTEYDLEVESDLWVIKKDGTINNIPTEALITHAGWNGDLTAIFDGTWQPRPCQIVVKCEVDPTLKYDDKYKIDYVNAWDSIPGSGNAVLDANQVKALASRYGSQFRALAASVKQNAAPPAGKNPVLPKPTAKARTQQAASQAVQEAGEKFDTDINAQLQEAAEEEKDQIPL